MGRSHTQQIAYGIIDQALRDFPKVASRTLARKLYKEHPALWSTDDATLSAIRYQRGAIGVRGRDAITTTEHIRSQHETIQYTKLPEGIVQLEGWQAESIQDPGYWGIISDVHVPFHSVPAITAAWNQFKKCGKKLTGILINGDLADAHAVSFFEKDPRQKDFAGEIQKIRQFFEALRDAFPKVRIVYKWGNHEERWTRYMILKAPELLDLPEFDFRNLVQMDRFGIQEVKDKRPVLLGKLYVLHGHEFRRGFIAPVNPARGLFLKAQVSCLMGDVHQTSQHSEKNLAGHVTSCWSVGALCDLRPEYAPLNKWNHGCSLVHVGQQGSFEVQNFRIIDGSCYS